MINLTNCRYKEADEASYGDVKKLILSTSKQAARMKADTFKLVWFADAKLYPQSGTQAHNLPSHQVEAAANRNSPKLPDWETPHVITVRVICIW